MGEIAAADNFRSPALFIIDTALQLMALDHACQELLGFTLVAGQSVTCLREQCPPLYALLQGGAPASICWQDAVATRRFRASMTELEGAAGVNLRAIVIQETLGEGEHAACRQSRLEELNAGLAQRITEQVAKEVEKDRVLSHQARFAAMGEMIGVIAHQWRQPLATISALVQNLRVAFRADKLTGPYLEQTVEKAVEQCAYLSETLDEFRTYFRPEKTPELFNVREAIEDAVWLILPQLQEIGITISAKGGEFPPIHAHGYPNEFKQVLLNLISNSRDAVLERQQQDTDFAGLITITLAVCPPTVCVTVADNGCGVPVELRQRIFEPYFTTKSDEQGTGIGLYMSRMIIETGMGGALTLASDQQETTFIIELPGDPP